MSNGIKEMQKTIKITKDGAIYYTSCHAKKYDIEIDFADLRKANLCDADLRGADLRGAKLNNADLNNAKLCGANLHNADLNNANLREANLSSANLCGANLSSANLCGANLDFSVYPLWCGGLRIKNCERLIKQLSYHLLKLVQTNKIENFDIYEYANSSHIIEKHNLPKIIKESK